MKQQQQVTFIPYLSTIPKNERNGFVSLIKCPECKREISNKAEICPQCGFPISKTQKLNKRKNSLSAFKKNISLALNKIFESPPFMYLVFLPIMLCVGVAICLLGIWLLERLVEFNATLGLVALILGGNVIAWFASYKWGASKLFFWLVLIVTICFLSMFGNLLS